MLTFKLGGYEQRTGTQGMGFRQAREEDKHANLPQHSDNQQWPTTVSGMSVSLRKLRHAIVPRN